MEKADFKVTKEGTTLEVLLGRELSTSNAPAQMDELAKYKRVLRRLSSMPRGWQYSPVEVS